MSQLRRNVTAGTAALLLLPGATFAPGAGAATTPQTSDSLPDHGAFTEVLRPHVDPEAGRVDYAALKEDRTGLDRYLDRLAATDSGALADASRDARLAFWINAYNACMLKLVVDHYPLTEAGGGLVNRIANALAGRPQNSVWRISDVFTREHCTVAGEERSQDGIEHEIIRPMGEPRIHFAVNCAAVSCPVLAAEAYGAKRLDAQLDRQVRRFLRDPDHFRLEDGDPPVLTVNEVLSWYADDFGGTDGVREFFVPYVDAPRKELLRDPGTRVEYFDYDWTLNDVRR